MTPIRVLVVDDSLTIRRRIVEILRREPDLQVVGEAATGVEGVDLARSLRPDVITLDLVMPDGDGLAATEHIMRDAPTPILVVSASHNRGELFHTYDALAAGAVDVLDKRDGDPAWERELVSAVRLVSRIKVVTRPHVRHKLAPVPVELRPALGAPQLIALGASTGGPSALVEVFQALPLDFATPLVVVLHIHEAYATQLAAWLATQIKLPVALAQAGPVPARGVVIAPPNRHLIMSRGALAFSMAPPRHHCRPSIDVLFESLAIELGARASACLLTGMGRDGARGLLAIRRSGGLTIAQDEASSVVYGMPREAVACGAATHVLPLGEIGPTLKALGSAR